MATQALASWAFSLTPASLPPKVQYQAQRSFYNYVGCAIYGSAHPTVRRAHAALAPLFGAPTSTLLGWRAQDGGGGSGGGVRADAQHAALLNGIAAHVHDFDDTHLETIIHPTAAVASALLAWVEGCSSAVNGADFLVALVAGIEAECKLGMAVWPAHYDIGWHITSTVGSIGAAVAVGKAMGLDVARMAAAIGIAAVQVTGLREMFGSDTKAFHAGRAAQNGLLAALLAKKGFSSSERALEAPRGWANVVAGGGSPRLDEYVSQLGSIWETERNAFKPFACGIVCHPVIDACVQVHCELKARAEAQDSNVEAALEGLQSVKAAVHPLVLELTAKRAPRDGLDAKFSIFHGGAVGLLYGKAGVKEYSDEMVKNPTVIAVRDKINVEARKDIRQDEAVVVMAFEDGEEIEKHVEHATGSIDVPVTDAQLKEKFMDQASEVMGPDAASKASELCWGVADVSDVASLAATL